VSKTWADVERLHVTESIWKYDKEIPSGILT